MPAPPAADAWRWSLPNHPDAQGTGAVWLEYDPRDYQAIWEPGIAARASILPPTDISFVHLVKEPRLNQGQEGSCVPGSSEAACQMAHSPVDGTWPAYSIHQLYAEAGGHGADGVDVRTVMGICIDQGTPLVSGARDPVIKSYLFVDRSPGSFRTQVKASLAAGHPVLIACLLPIPFSWNSGTALSNAYHQWLAIGWQTDSQGVEWCIVLNQWGDGWPGDQPAGTPGGIGRIRFDVLEANSLQNGYVYGVIPTTSLVTPPPPPPPPPVGRTVSGPTQGTAQGPGSNLLAVGQQIPVSGGSFTGTMTIAQISDGGPTPPPVGPTITGYTPNPVQGGTAFLTQGSGFTSDATVTWNGVTLNLLRLGPNEIQTVAPNGGTPNPAPIVVTQANGTATGPPLTLTTTPTPPPGDLVVLIHPPQGGGLRAEVHDSSGQRLSAFCHAVVNGVDKGQSNTSLTKYAFWVIGSPPAGSVAVVTAVTPDGTKSGTSSLTF